MDPNFRQLHYVRYADTFLIGVVGSLKETNQIKDQVKAFLSESLHLEMHK
jgi:hypothetical protein